MSTEKALEQSAVERVKYAMKKIKSANKELNALLFINEEAQEQAEKIDQQENKGKLAGLTVAVKANISTKNMPISCGSLTLENYKGLYDADVITKIKDQGAVIIGIANCDEFGCGSSGENSAFGATKNPAALTRITGGSSSGSAAAVAAEFCDLALGSDTGGSIRNPASHCGVVGIKPSYGRVSRYGLVDLAMSLDTIGVMSKDVYGSALLLETIAGESKYDARSIKMPVEKYNESVKKAIKKPISIGICQEIKELCDDKELYEKAEQAAHTLAKQVGGEVKKNTNTAHFACCSNILYVSVS